MKQNLRRAYIALTLKMIPNPRENVGLMAALEKKCKKIWENPEEGDVKDLYLVFNMANLIKQPEDDKAKEKGDKGKR